MVRSTYIPKATTTEQKSNVLPALRPKGAMFAKQCPLDQWFKFKSGAGSRLGYVLRHALIQRLFMCLVGCRHIDLPPVRFNDIMAGSLEIGTWRALFVHVSTFSTNVETERSQQDVDTIIGGRILAQYVLVFNR